MTYFPTVKSSFSSNRSTDARAISPKSSSPVSSAISAAASSSIGMASSSSHCGVTNSLDAPPHSAKRFRSTRCFGCHSTNSYGPVPTGFRAYSSPSSVTAFFERIEPP